MMKKIGRRDSLNGTVGPRPCLFVRAAYWTIVCFVACSTRDFAVDAGPPDVDTTDSGPVTFPDGATVDAGEAGPASRTVFLSSETFAGDLGGAAGADAKCQALAGDAGLAGQYKAWISTSASSPSTRFTQSDVPYVLLTGEAVSYSYPFLVAGKMLHPINVDEHMMVYDGGCIPTYEPCGWTAVWTQTRADGTWEDSGTSTSCASFTDADGSTGHIGSYQSTDSTWTSGTGAGAPPLCSTTFPIYCFEQ